MLHCENSQIAVLQFMDVKGFLDFHICSVCNTIVLDIILGFFSPIQSFIYFIINALTHLVSRNVGGDNVAKVWLEIQNYGARLFSVSSGHTYLKSSL